jgi:PAS domain-containing protein
MKNVYEVLRQKELELSRLEKEVEALRVAAPLLADDGEAGNDTPQNGRAAVWQGTAKHWP